MLKHRRNITYTINTKAVNSLISSTPVTEKYARGEDTTTEIKTPTNQKLYAREYCPFKKYLTFSMKVKFRVSLLIFFGLEIGLGAPQPIQLLASVEIFLPHSLQATNAILIS
jgi:hypothetical protein